MNYWRLFRPKRHLHLRTVRTLIHHLSFIQVVFISPNIIVITFFLHKSRSDLGKSKRDLWFNCRAINFQTKNYVSSYNSLIEFLSKAQTFLKSAAYNSNYILQCIARTNLGKLVRAFVLSTCVPMLVPEITARLAKHQYPIVRCDPAHNGNNPPRRPWQHYRYTRTTGEYGLGIQFAL